MGTYKKYPHYDEDDEDYSGPSGFEFGEDTDWDTEYDPDYGSDD